jgi:hypothetical protein
MHQGGAFSQGGKMQDQSLSLLDGAAQAMADLPDGSAAHLRFYQILAETPLVLLLTQEADGGDLAPRLFDLPSGALVLAFDSEERLAIWAQDNGLGPQPYAELPARVIAQQLGGFDTVGLGLNFGAGTPSEMILPPQALAWLREVLDIAPQTLPLHIAEVLPLPSPPPEVMAALSIGLARAGGLAQAARLAKVRFGTGAQGHVLAIFGASPQSEAPLSRAVAEALAFSGQEAAMLDVTFLAAESPLAAPVLRLGVEVALPPPLQAAPPTAATPRAPGMDKAAPPKLR